MPKLIFLFHRKDGLTREEFFEHYLEVHAPLGMRLTRNMDGYTVNLVDTEAVGAPDAITEIWTASTAEFFDPAKSFATPEDAKELMTDHDSFIGPYDAYVVEERVVRGAAPDGRLGAPTPGAKVVSLHRDPDAVPEPPAGATCVVDQVVQEGVTPGAPPLALIRAVWAPDVAAIGPLGDDAYEVREYRQLAPVG
jgi:EthD domain